jgi:hypothetical protein
MNNVAHMLEPDAAMMRQHVGHLFEGWLDGCHEGRIELAWTDGRDGKLRHAAIFGTDELDELVERALAENRKPGQNVYIGQALRHPDIAPFGRCKDDDFLALTAFYADIDDDVVLAAAAKYKVLGCLPTAMVITGRHPHPRAQMLWRLAAPVRDADLCRRQNLAIAQALGGDPSVINPSRVLRLGGSIAWPSKEGRIIERTELRLLRDGRPAEYLPGQIAKAFPPVEPELSSPVASSASTAPQTDGFLSTTPSATLPIGTSNLSVEACLARIRAGDHWHDNLVRLTGHWIARGWSDAEIITATEALTLPGYTVAQTRREVASMIRGGRYKWATPNPNNTIEEQEPKPFVLRPVGLLEPSKRPPRDWVVRHRLMRKHSTVTAAAPGVGKSTLTIEEAVSLASGKDFLGFGVDRSRKVAVINNEETRDELERRIEATCVRFEVPFPSIAENLYLHSGVDAEKFVVARRGPNDSVAIDVRSQQLSEFLRDAGIELLVNVQVHTVSENVNEEIEQVMMALREISVRANCALYLVHHTRKPPAGTAHQAGDIFAVRGGGAIVGDAHFVFTLADMGQADGEALGVADADRKKFIRLDDAKGKLAPPSGARWFEREGVTMPYGLIGEEVGVLVPRSFEQALGSSDISMFTATEILREIDKRWRDGNPFSASVQSPRYVVPVMVRDHGCSPKSARSFLRDWLAKGIVASLAYDKHAKAQGLKVLAWPG